MNIHYKVYFCTTKKKKVKEGKESISFLEKKRTAIMLMIKHNSIYIYIWRNHIFKNQVEMSLCRLQPKVLSEPRYVNKWAVIYEQPIF